MELQEKDVELEAHDSFAEFATEIGIADGSTISQALEKKDFKGFLLYHLPFQS